MSCVYPPMDDVRRCSREVAIAVARRAAVEGVAAAIPDVEEKVDAAMWEPEYLPYRPA